MSSVDAVTEPPVSRGSGESATNGVNSEPQEHLAKSVAKAWRRRGIIMCFVDDGSLGQIGHRNRARRGPGARRHPDVRRSRVRHPSIQYTKLTYRDIVFMLVCDNVHGSREGTSAIPKWTPETLPSEFLRVGSVKMKVEESIGEKPSYVGTYSCSRAW